MNEIQRVNLLHLIITLQNLAVKKKNDKMETIQILGFDSLFLAIYFCLFITKN